MCRVTQKPNMVLVTHVFIHLNTNLGQHVIVNWVTQPTFIPYNNRNLALFKYIMFISSMNKLNNH